MSAPAVAIRTTLFDRMLAHRGRLTVSTALVLCGALFAYSRLVSPYIDPRDVIAPAADSVRGETIPSPLEPLKMAERHLAAHPWVARAKYQLRTADAFLYFEEWDRAEGDQAIRFSPFAMIWRRSGQSPDEQPLTIIADTAQVRFLSKFEITNNPGRVTGGAFEGTVHIAGPDGLAVTGRNFVFSEEALRVWSDHDLSFAYGPHSGRAHGAQIELIPTPIVDPKDSLAIAGIKSLRLRRDVDMELVSDGSSRGGPLAGRSGGRAGNEDGSTAQTPREPVRVRVRSAGSFEYVVQSHLATYDEQVRVTRPTGPDEFDTLDGDRLTLVFEPEEIPPRDGGPADDAVRTADAQPVPDATTHRGGPEGAAARLVPPGHRLAFRRLLAEGTRVVLASQGQDLTAFMTQFVYDAPSRTAALSDPKLVQVHRGTSQLRAPEVEIRHEPDGQVASAVCRGAGWLQHRDPETGRLAMAAQWERQLTVSPDPEAPAAAPVDVVVLEHKALVRQPHEKTGIAAETITLRVERTPRDPHAEAPRRSGSAAPASGFRPRHASAVKNVVVASPDLLAETERLDIDFVDPPAASAPETGPRLAGAASAGPDGAVVPASGTQPDRGARRPAGSDDERRAPREPVEVVAESVRISAVHQRQSNDVEVSEIRARGDVRIRQRHGTDAEAMALSGEEFHLSDARPGREVLHVVGAPAHVRDRGMHIEGRNVHLDRHGNRAWVEGRGLLELPVNRTADGAKLDDPRRLDVWWTERMEFDGETARFFGDVRADHDDSLMKCHEMHVRMTRRLDFTDPQGSRDVQVQEVLCRDGVQLDSQEYEERRLVGLRQARFFELILDQRTGRTKATGPGHIVSWRRGTGRNSGAAALGAGLSGSGPAPNAAPARNAAADRGGDPERVEWEYVRIDFSGQAAGNLKSRNMTFADRVQVVYGPVPRPLDVVDVDRLPRDGGWLRTEKLRFVQHAAPAGTQGSGPVEMLAEGNGELEGREFHARADQISFDQAKGLYVLRSLGDRKATIWRQKALGGEFSRADAQRMEFVPGRNQLKLDQTTGLDGIN